MTAWVAGSVFAIAYALIASEKVSRIGVALTGAGAMVIIGATNAERMFYDAEHGIDWNVIFLLFGMMIIVGFIHKTGVFEYLAVGSIQLSRGNPKTALAYLIVLTALASALLDNVTTILLVVPMTLFVTKHLRVAPVPFLLAEVFASNIGGAATLVGDPPNIIIASRAGLSFNDFLLHLGPVSVVSVAVIIPVLQFMFRKQLRNSREDRSAIKALRTESYIKDRVLLYKSLCVLLLVLIGFVTHAFTHVEPSVVALLGAGVLAAIGGARPSEYLRDIEWETLLFFAGLFVMVGALVNVGVLEAFADFLQPRLGDEPGPAAVSLLMVSALLSGIVDNIPYVVSMSPVVADLTVGFQGGAGDSLWWALALGADFGGNATIIGASANVVAMGLARKAGYHVSFVQFTKYGLVITAISVGIAVAYVQLRYA